MLIRKNKGFQECNRSIRTMANATGPVSKRREVHLWSHIMHHASALAPEALDRVLSRNGTGSRSHSVSWN